MMRLIDADAIKNGKFHGIEDWTPVEQASWQWGWNDAIDAIINGTPTVDAVEVVRCKDCTHYHGVSCYVNEIEMGENDFCSWGERKDEVTE